MEIEIKQIEFVNGFMNITWLGVGGGKKKTTTISLDEDDITKAQRIFVDNILSMSTSIISEMQKKNPNCKCKNCGCK